MDKHKRSKAGQPFPSSSSYLCCDDGVGSNPRLDRSLLSVFVPLTTEGEGRLAAADGTFFKGGMLLLREDLGRLTADPRNSKLLGWR